MAREVVSLYLAQLKCPRFIRLVSSTEIAAGTLGVVSHHAPVNVPRKQVSLLWVCRGTGMSSVALR